MINVGIREQLLVSAGAGPGAGRDAADRAHLRLVPGGAAFEQIKLDFGHQDVGGVLVSSGGSFDIASGGRTHQSPGDVALLDTLPGIAIHVPATRAEVDAAIRASVGRRRAALRARGRADQRRVFPHRRRRFHTVRHEAGAPGRRARAAARRRSRRHRGQDVTVLYANTVRPFDASRPAPSGGTPEVSWSSPTSPARPRTRCRSRSRRSRTGCWRSAWAGELRRYGSADDHVAAHGLDATGIRAAVDRFLDLPRSRAA